MKNINLIKIALPFFLVGLLYSCNSKPKAQEGVPADSVAQEQVLTPAAEVPVNTEVPDEPEEPSTEAPKAKSELEPVDQAYEDCMGLLENQTTVGMCDCAAQAQGGWDKQMNEYYSLLMSKLKEDEKSKLKISQQKWMAFRDAEFDFSGMTYYNMEGSMYKVMAVERQKEFVKARAQELKLYYSVFIQGEQ